MPHRNKLQGFAFLVTRPASQAEPLCELINTAGGRAIRFPLLRIFPAEPLPESILTKLDQYDIAIFISPNAVEFGLAAINRFGGLPDNLSIAAVGATTARMLAEALGRAPDLVPEERFDSDGLLALPALQDVAGKRILIIRGNGGRERLAEVLRERGASVDYAEVYRRESARLEDAEPDWLEHSDAILMSSGEALQNLLALIPEQQSDTLLAKPLIVVSERLAELAAEAGFIQQTRVARNATDEAIMEAVLTWAAENRKP